MKPISISSISFLLEIIKVRQVAFSKRGYLLLLVCSIACQPPTKKKEARDTITILQKVAVADIEIRSQEGLVFYENQPFTGVVTEYYDNGQLAKETSYFQGKKEGSFRKWFDTGIKSYEATYLEGRLNGVAKSWWKNGKIRSEAQYEYGIANGIQRQWYQSGNLFKEMHMVDGHEEGLQKAWRENGKLYNNYEAKNGRIFGLKRANLCYELQNEIVQN
ncbi:toxin-antitoxin system YwqK family antitoxin [Flavobacteriaceae bacterium F08102]|nr:toxin-antitoxin system YwqK family antitoxin [Flavobacteriaceae bacterium F08102]